MWRLLYSDGFSLSDQLQLNPQYLDIASVAFNWWKPSIFELVAEIAHLALSLACVRPTVQTVLLDRLSPAERLPDDALESGCYLLGLRCKAE